jgi:hypothetical protein
MSVRNLLIRLARFVFEHQPYLAFLPALPSDSDVSVLGDRPFSHHLSSPRFTFRPSLQCHLPASFGSTALNKRCIESSLSSSISSRSFDGPPRLSASSLVAKSGHAGSGNQNVLSRFSRPGSIRGVGGRGHGGFHRSLVGRKSARSDPPRSRDSSGGGKRKCWMK